MSRVWQGWKGGVERGGGKGGGYPNQANSGVRDKCFLPNNGRCYPNQAKSGGKG